MVGSMAASQRLIQREKDLDAKRNMEIADIRNQILKMGSAIQALNFENAATKKSWEYPNIKLFSPILKEEDRFRINRLLTRDRFQF